MKIRKYEEKDLTEIIDLFVMTVKTINSKDYSSEQVKAWISSSKDKEKWNESFLKYFTLVAIIDDKIVGFANLDKTGYLDRLYVHHEYQGQKIATKLCDEIEKEVNADIIYTFASITAKPFFLKRGYKVIKENLVDKEGVILINYLMYKDLPKDNIKSHH